MEEVRRQVQPTRHKDKPVSRPSSLPQSQQQQNHAMPLWPDAMADVIDPAGVDPGGIGPDGIAAVLDGSGIVAHSVIPIPDPRPMQSELGKQPSACGKQHPAYMAPVRPTKLQLMSDGLSIEGEWRTDLSPDHREAAMQDLLTMQHRSQQLGMPPQRQLISLHHSASAPSMDPAAARLGSRATTAAPSMASMWGGPEGTFSASRASFYPPAALGGGGSGRQAAAAQKESRGGLQRSGSHAGSTAESRGAPQRIGSTAAGELFGAFLPKGLRATAAADPVPVIEMPKPIRIPIPPSRSAAARGRAASSQNLQRAGAQGAVVFVER